MPVVGLGLVPVDREDAEILHREVVEVPEHVDPDHRDVRIAVVDRTLELWHETEVWAVLREAPARDEADRRQGCDDQHRNGDELGLLSEHHLAKAAVHQARKMGENR